MLLLAIVTQTATSVMAESPAEESLEHSLRSALFIPEHMEVPAAFVQDTGSPEHFTSYLVETRDPAGGRPSLLWAFEGIEAPDGTPQWATVELQPTLGMDHWPLIDPDSGNPLPAPTAIRVMALPASPEIHSIEFTFDSEEAEISRPRTQVLVHRGTRASVVERVEFVPQE